jgi:hypothetical protein
MSSSVLHIGSSAMQHWLRAMYPSSVELNSISVCSFLNQFIGTPANTMINPVRDKHESRKYVNSWFHTPAKSLSQYVSSERFCLVSW